MKDVELMLKEKDLGDTGDYSIRQFGVVQVDAFIGCIAVVFDVLVMHEIGTYRMAQ